MKERSSPGAQLFVGIGLWIVAWHLMPAHDWHLNSKIFVGFVAICGTICVIAAIADGARRTNLWWQGLAGQLVVVIGLWLTIAAAVWYYGTPHVLLEYPSPRSAGRCIYLGWGGILAIDGDKNCPALLIVRRKGRSR